MANVRNQGSCSSTCYYDVFLSFRGEDTRKSFTDHLYEALVRHGFRTFRDDDEIEKGENLKSELKKAISHSKISVLVLSKDYASSTWCLDEVVMILEQRRRNSKHVVIPVFYNVDPSQIRKQTGTTAEAFARYEKKMEAETDREAKTKLMEKIKKWRSALTEVAGFTGLYLKNQVDGHEAKFIQKIITVIEDKLRQKILDVAQYEIGLDSRAKNINMWLQDGSTDAGIRAICGMSGIGKTTIAKFVYNENYNSFEGSSFLANISEVSEQPNGLLRLQRQLLSDISRRKHGKINNVDEGLVQIRKLLCGKRVLLVLDDVKKVDQIYVVLGMQDWLFPGSKIIITTRHERLLKPHQICRVQKLGEDESIKLFSLHAFGKDHPMESYIEHTKRVVKICKGLPLALKVIGSSLSGKREDEWVCELKKLEAIPHNEILTKLKTSFDSLQDDYDKRLFLHIACFFVGTDTYYAIKVLEKCDLHAKIGIQNLIDRCLLERDSHEVLKMHKLIQDMGREIIHQESQEPGERSRLWHHQETLSVLQNETGTKTVEGLYFDMRKVDEARNNGKRRQYKEFCDNLILSNYFGSVKRRCLSLFSGQSISTTLTSQNDVFLRTDALKSMINLMLLELNYVKLTGNYDNFPKGLVWLSWHGFPLESIPSNLPLTKVVALDLTHSRLQQVWKKTPFLESLKILDMSFSERLKQTPNFVFLPNLERLILKGCVSLVEVCESIGNLEMLEFLNLSGCKALRKLPRNIGKLRSLKTLEISDCNISELPSEMRDMKSLEVLDASGIDRNPLHNSCEEVKWWQPMNVWSRVKTTRRGPETLWTSLPLSLQQLNLSGCNLSDVSFPENFGDLPSLVYLNLSENPFRRLPNCINSLTKLEYLFIRRCHRLQSLDLNGLSDCSGYIDAGDCTSLEKIKSKNVSVYLDLSGCSKLVEIEDYLKGDSSRNDSEIINTLDKCVAGVWGMFEFGIFSIYTESGEFPILSSEKIKGSSVSFTVPLHPTYRIQCFNAFCTYTSTRYRYGRSVPWVTELHTHVREKCVYVKIENKTKNLTWIYRPRYFQFGNSDWEWRSRWRFGNQLEAGDEITITFDGEGEFEVKECGYKIMYHDEEKQNEEGNTTFEKSHHDFPEFRLSTGEYFLCRLFKRFPDERLFKRFPDEDYWFPKSNVTFSIVC